MRRVVVGVLTCLLAACGLSVTGSGQPTADPVMEAGASLPEGGDSLPDVIVPPRPRPDAGAPFLPSHISGSAYVLDAPDVTDVDEIDTTSLVLVRGNAFSPSEYFIADGNYAVLSVGALDVTKPIRVAGTRALVIVAAKDVRIASAITARASLTRPGPGGFDPALGDGKGGDGTVSAGSYSGGGGAGHGAAAAAGGTLNLTAGGLGGIASGDPHTVLVGGSGGGNGGRAASCIGDRGRGGAGGGAIQITTLGKMAFVSGGGINVGGGGGSGGCPSTTTGQAEGGGGGGGSGGTVFLEAVGSATFESGAFLFAGGGGGGQGGSLSSVGGDGADALALTAAAGGTGAGGGAGGAGGVLEKAASPGANALPPAASGGGGGAPGRLFLRTRGAPAKLLGSQNAVYTLAEDF